MDRRREHRFTTDQAAKITLLSEPKQEMDGCVKEVSGRGMRLSLSKQLPLSAPVRVDVNGWMVLGEVCHCERSEGHFVVGLALDQVLHDTTPLLPLIQALTKKHQECRESDGVGRPALTASGRSPVRRVTVPEGQMRGAATQMMRDIIKEPQR